ncbi:universal stress protein [Amycolatopsis rhizosphaerae]|uniref:universal stress protein n=1 Tax=Amycolatopsis rhizosphaerae TaxID=2053003 RepID=UPI001FE2B16F|nr:universal stress protein [Amycolatopsis rhizosphaerae]
MVRGAEGAIVVGVDGSGGAALAVRWAAAEAGARNLPLHLLFAAGWVGGGYGGGLPVPQSYFDDLDQAGKTLLAEAKRAAREVSPGVAVTSSMPFEPPVPPLVDASERARMLVLGATGRTGFAGRLAGATAVAVAARALCPVAIVRPRTDGLPIPANAPVVVGVDGSHVSDRAVAVAFEEASWRRVPLIAVHAFSDADAGLLLPEPDRGWGTLSQQQERLLAENLAGWREEYPEVQLEPVAVRDQPRAELLARSEAAQLLVVGSRGRGGVTGLLLGSTSQALIHHAQCPVLVVRAAAPAP